MQKIWRYLNAFNSKYDEYRRLDDEILPLSTENTNMKAQRLSFGAAREAADAFRTSIAAALKSGSAKDACAADLAGARAQIALLEIQVLAGAAHRGSRGHGDDADGGADGRVGGQRAEGARRAADDTESCRNVAARRGRRRTGSVHVGQQGDRRALTSQQQRSVARVISRPKAHRHGGMQAQLQGLEETLAKHQFSATR